MMSQLKEINLKHLAYEWTVFQEKSFSVQVRGWGTEGNFKWNVYALIFDNHPLFNNVDAALCLHFHGGPTYDKIITTDEAQGYQYNWQKQSKVLKIGSDYAHAYDCFEDDDPKGGIPFSVQWDAQKLAEELHERILDI